MLDISWDKEDMHPANGVIVFDLFGVICSEIAPFWLPKYLDAGSAVKVKATVVHAADIGEISQQEMFDKLGEIVNISPERAEEEWWTYVNIDEDVVDIVRKLRVYYPVALLTNSPAQFARQILGKYDLLSLFDPIVVSSEEKCAKPDLAIYERMIERLAVQPEDVLLIDDNPINIKGAIDAGWNGLVFESSMQLQMELFYLNYL